MSEGSLPPQDSEPLVTPEMVPPQPPRGYYGFAPPPPPRPAGSRWWVWLLLLGIFGGGIGLLVLLAGYGGSMGPDVDVREQYHSGARLARNKIAIIRVEGTITTGEGYFKDQIEAVKQDKHVKGVVLRINSPGGTVTGSDYLYHHLRQMAEERKIPLVVSMGSLCASGGYYLAMAVGDQDDSIYAEPTTWTGSIGVIIPHYNVGGLMQEWSIKEDSIASHRLKQMGSITREMTEEERAIFQGLVDETFNRFKDIVKAGRPKLAENPARLDEVATGQIFTTKQALDLGLVDREGFLEEAIERTLELANLDGDKTKIVEYEAQLGLFDEVFMSSAIGGPPQATLASLLDLSAPRAYYLYTLLPGLDLAPSGARH